MDKLTTIFLKRIKTNENIRISIASEEQSYIIGRSKECNCTISGNPMISRQHIELSAKDGDIYIEDLGSKYLTFLDDVQVTEPVKLENSQILKLADELFTIEFIDGDHNDTNKTELIRPTCPICHSPIDENDKFCTVCGSFIG